MVRQAHHPMIWFALCCGAASVARGELLSGRETSRTRVSSLIQWKIARSPTATGEKVASPPLTTNDDNLPSEMLEAKLDARSSPGMAYFACFVGGVLVGVFGCA